MIRIETAKIKSKESLNDIIAKLACEMTRTCPADKNEVESMLHKLTFQTIDDILERYEVNRTVYNYDFHKNCERCKK